jgi:hypothetical protein
VTPFFKPILFPTVLADIARLVRQGFAKVGVTVSD